MWRQPRSIALADAILASCGGEGTLREFAESEQARPLRLLEINKAGTLSPRLRRLPGHVFGGYPALDMQAMSYPDASFNLIAHSDALLASVFPNCPRRIAKRQGWKMLCLANSGYPRMI
jgi:hypothetical protein